MSSPSFSKSASSEKKVVFSFAIYGSQRKYCQGLVENLEMIRDVYPSWYTYIHVYNDVPLHYIETYLSFPNVRLIYPQCSNHPNMVDRFMVLDNDPTVDVMIVRDADSRIHTRDQYCIKHFLADENVACHTIRDHFLHHSPIMGGLWGLKRGHLDVPLHMLYQQFLASLSPSERQTNGYGHDMRFLSMRVYPLVVSSLVVYTFTSELRISEPEQLHIIPFPVDEHVDFCGQVIVYDPSTNQPIREHPHPGQPYVPPSSSRKPEHVNIPQPQLHQSHVDTISSIEAISDPILYEEMQDDPRFQKSASGMLTLQNPLKRKKVSFGPTLYMSPPKSAHPSSQSLSSPSVIFPKPPSF